MAPENAATPSVGLLNPRPPRTYVEWTVRGRAGSSSACFSTFSEADARRAYAKWLDHGEPVELVKREVTTWTEIRYTSYEVVSNAT